MPSWSRNLGVFAVGAGVAAGIVVLAFIRADAFHAPVGSPPTRPSVETWAGQSAESLISALGCGSCHLGVAAPTSPVAAPLAARDRSRDPASTFAYMRGSPRAASPGEAHVPAFHLDDAEAAALSLYLAGGRPGGGEVGRRFDAARRTRDEVDAETGARIFRALNCAACHPHEGVEARRNGPPLAGVASRLRAAALREFLRRPHAVRPFGFEPGSGGRMPNFVLGDAEVDSIVAYLSAFSVSFEPVETIGSGVLSVFGAAKARSLLERKLSCLGCHALNGEGGRIGPDLARAGERLTSEYLAAIISNPQQAMPGTVMPRPVLPAATRDLILAFLADRGGTETAAGGAAGDVAGPPENAGDSVRAGYLSLIDHPVSFPSPLSGSRSAASSVAELEASASLYAAQCAMCHGAEGRGDGYNARYLRASPALHASADSMGLRPDDTLFDGIHAGGAILGGSPEMPAFGESLTSQQIAGLVTYIRALCDCRGPAWSEGR